MTENKLATQFTGKSIFAYALPTMVMMVFMSLYMMIDGMFVAKYVDEFAFSALNIVYPVISIVLALGLMLSIGASAVIGTLMGEGKEGKAREFFTQIYLVGILLGSVCLLLTQVFVDEILLLLQASALLYPYAKEYLIFTGYFFIFSTLQVFAQTFFITAGKPLLGTVVCVLGGCTNIFLDWLFIAKLGWGIAGAGIATGIGFGVPGLFSLVYFGLNRKSSLYFVPFHWDMPNFILTCSNGMSECVTNLSVAMTTFLFNVILQRLVGEAGVSSITAILYIQMFQMGVYTGFSLGVSPILSYKFGAKDWSQLKKVVQSSFVILGICSFLVVSLSFLFAEEAIAIFIPKESDTFPLAKRGLLLYTLAYIFMGFNVFFSSFFTALSNGKVSALLSLTRNFCFIVLGLLVLPEIFHTDGVWIAVPIAEFLSFLMGGYFFRKYQKKYRYYSNWKKD
ncbi:MAG: MATE family efflux transporter [Eubacteriales bacterium]